MCSVHVLYSMFTISRSTSSSPGRHKSPDCAKMKLVSAGTSFCLVKDEPVMETDLRNGRKSPFISNRAWPKALRTRSASKERISSKHNILQGPINQIKEFQDKKLPLQQFSKNLSDSEDYVQKRREANLDRNLFTRSQSQSHSYLHVQSQPSSFSEERESSEGERPKGILKKSHAYVPRVHERISNYQYNVEQTQSKHQSTLPWNSKICRENSQESMIRKTASSPCLFVKNKTPMRMCLGNPKNILENSFNVETSNSP